MFDKLEELVTEAEGRFENKILQLYLSAIVRNRGITAFLFWPSLCLPLCKSLQAIGRRLKRLGFRASVVHRNTPACTGPAQRYFSAQALAGACDQGRTGSRRKRSRHSGTIKGNERSS